jgi:hypothetical protein
MKCHVGGGGRQVAPRHAGGFTAFVPNRMVGRGRRRAGPPFGLAPGSALGSRPRVALSSAQVTGQGTSAWSFGQGVCR